MVKFGTHMTGGALGPDDHGILDVDVLGVIMAAYSHAPLEELATFDGIMRSHHCCPSCC